MIINALYLPKRAMLPFSRAHTPLWGVAKAV
jgi:hypothetical protein